MSLSDEKTEKKLKALEKKISKAYQEAYNGLNKEAQKYFATYEERWKKEYQAYLDGKYTDLEFKNWEQAQLGRGKRWEKLRDDMAEHIHKANEVAAAYVNDDTPSIYSLNHNYQAYQIDSMAKADDVAVETWDLVDEQTVKNMVTKAGNYTEFKTLSSNPTRDYEWNTSKINSALLSGIMQGKSIDKIADSFYEVMKSNRTAAIRNARTAYTSAQNAGRIKSLQQAKKMGINVKKKWMATNDARTRFSHALLDGQIREVEKEFSNGLMQPGDSSGIPGEVYNCRCTLTYVYGDYDHDVSNERWDSMTKDERKAEEKKYKEWVKEQQGKHKSLVPDNPVLTKNQNGSILKSNEIGTVKTTSKASKYTKEVIKQEERAIKFSEKVSFEGLSGKTCKKVNDTLEYLTSKYPTRKLGVIRTSYLSKATAQANANSLILSRKLLNDSAIQKAANDFKLDAISKIQQMAELRKQAVKETNPIVQQIRLSYIEKIEKESRYKRYNVAYNVESAIYHDYAHIIADQSIGQINGVNACKNANTKTAILLREKISGCKKTAQQDGFIFDLSKYADKDEAEFFAECFTAREIGEKVPEYINNMLEDIINYGKL